MHYCDYKNEYMPMICHLKSSTKGAMVEQELTTLPMYCFVHLLSCCPFSVGHCIV
jgi:hypothetical protein